MGSALIGFLAVAGIFHILLVIIPVMATLRAPISGKSKAIWCAFLLLIPIIGVGVFHFRFRSSLLLGKSYERSAAEERASSGTLAPHDDNT